MGAPEPTADESAYGYYFALQQDRPGIVTTMIERKHARLLELALLGARGRRLLEIGPGEGFVARAALDRGIDYTAVEGTETGARLIRSLGVDVHVGYVPPIPGPDGSADVVYASHLIEHLPDGGAVREFLVDARRIAGTAGRIAVVFPDYRWMPVGFYDSDYTHTWPSTPRRVEQVARDAGLRVAATHHMCLSLSGLPAFLLRVLTRLLPTGPLALVDRSRRDLWWRSRLFFVPDCLMLLEPHDG